MLIIQSHYGITGHELVIGQWQHRADLKKGNLLIEENRMATGWLLLTSKLINETSCYSQ
jgi:hypothetical protein